MYPTYCEIAQIPFLQIIVYSLGVEAVEPSTNQREIGLSFTWTESGFPRIREISFKMETLLVNIIIGPSGKRMWLHIICFVNEISNNG